MAEELWHVHLQCMSVCVICRSEANLEQVGGGGGGAGGQEGRALRQRVLQLYGVNGVNCWSCIAE